MNEKLEHAMPITFVNWQLIDISCKVNLFWPKLLQIDGERYFICCQLMVKSGSNSGNLKIVSDHGNHNENYCGCLWSMDEQLNIFLKDNIKCTTKEWLSTVENDYFSYHSFIYWEKKCNSISIIWPKTPYFIKTELKHDRQRLKNVIFWKWGGAAIA